MDERYYGKKAGKIYLQTAKRLLRKYYFYSPANEGTAKNIKFMTEKKYHELLEEADFRRLEGFVDVQEYLTIVADTVKVLLEDCNIDVPQNLADILFLSQDPLSDLKECIDQIEGLQFNNGEKGAIAYAVMVNVHDLLIWNLSGHFFIKYRLHNAYQFLPLELTGLEFYERSYDIYVRPLLEALSLGTDMEFIDRAYICQQDAFLKKFNIRDYATLKQSFSTIDCAAWAPNIRDAIRSDPEAQDRLASQALERNPVLW